MLRLNRGGWHDHGSVIEDQDIGETLALLGVREADSALAFVLEDSTNVEA